MVNVLVHQSVVMVLVVVSDIHQTFVSAQMKIAVSYHVQLRLQAVQLYRMVDVLLMEYVVVEVCSLFIFFKCLEQ